jgi:hypothetical protein
MDRMQSEGEEEVEIDYEKVIKEAKLKKTLLQSREDYKQ